MEMPPIAPLKRAQIIVAGFIDSINPDLVVFAAKMQIPVSPYEKLEVWALGLLHQNTGEFVALDLEDPNLKVVNAGQIDEERLEHVIRIVCRGKEWTIRKEEP